MTHGQNPRHVRVSRLSSVSPLRGVYVLTHHPQSGNPFGIIFAGYWVDQWSIKTKTETQSEGKTDGFNQKVNLESHLGVQFLYTSNNDHI